MNASPTRIATSPGAAIYDLSSGSIAALVDSADYELLYQSARALPEWNEPALKTVSETLLQWVTDALGRRDNAADLRALRRLLERLQVQKKTEATPALDVAGAYRLWTALVSMLDARLSALAAQNDRSIESRAHVGALKALVCRLTAPEQASKLRERLGLSAPRMSQLLALTEEAGLITRKLEGREHWVMPAGRWTLRREPTPTTAIVDVPVMPRAASFFTLKRAD